MRKSIPAVFAGTLLASVALTFGGSIHPLLPAGAFAQGTQAPAGAVVYENLGFKGAYGAITIPRIVVEGTNASKADIEALFDGARTADVGTRLSRISARSISIPLIEVRQDTPDGPATTVYRDTVFRNVQNGIIGDGVTPQMTVKGKFKAEGAGAKTTDFDLAAQNMVLKGFDLGLMLRAFFEKGQPNEPLKVAAVEQSLGRISLTVGNDLKMTIAGTSIRDFKMRALEKPMMTAIVETQQNEKAKVPDWEKKNLALVMPMLNMMGIGTMEMTGLTAEFNNPAAKSKGTFGIDKMIASGNSLLPENFTIQGLRVNADGANIRFGEVTFEGFDFAPMMALQTSLNDNKATEADIAAALPKLGRTRLAGIDIDVPNSSARGERVKAKLGLFDLRMANHVGPIPANIGLVVDGFQMDIPANTREKGLKDLLALGYKALDVSARYNQVWDAAAKTLKLNELSVSSRDMFSMSAKAELQNVTGDLFALDRAKAAVAALGVSAQSVDVAFTNNSLFERVLAGQAKDSGRKVDDIRAELAAGAALMVPMLMGDHPAARTLGPIIGKFVAEPKNLKVKLTTKDPAGLGATDFIGAANPMDLLKKVDITASANE
jgi:hypothetical protein